MKTSSWSMPNIFNVAQNTVAILTDEVSVANRCKLLILTEPTEIYNEPNQGVGLKRHLFTYNNEVQKALIQDRIVEQLRIHEPCCYPDNTQFADGAIFTNPNNEGLTQQYNVLEMTVGIDTTFGERIDVNLE